MRRLAGRDTWVFDLDNTLYPPSCMLFDQIAARMTEFIMARLGLDKPQAEKLRHGYFKRYGTTLRGLMLEHGLPPQGFLDYVHDIDYSPVAAQPNLVREIGRLPGRKLIFTAGTRGHAASVLRRLGAADLFECIYDIVDAGFIPKPDARPYAAFLATHGVAPTRAAFFEDLAENLIVPRAMGMTTVLVGHHDEAQLPAHVDYVTADLAGFLEGITA